MDPSLCKNFFHNVKSERYWNWVEVNKTVRKLLYSFHEKCIHFCISDRDHKFFCAKIEISHRGIWRTMDSLSMTAKERIIDRSRKKQ